LLFQMGQQLVPLRLGIEREDAEEPDARSERRWLAEQWESGKHMHLPILGALEAAPSLYTAVRMVGGCTS
jgi:hypothetical protein